MAECMARLAADPELAARLGSAARSRIRAEFSMDKSLSSLFQILDDARWTRKT